MRRQAMEANNSRENRVGERNGGNSFGKSKQHFMIKMGEIEKSKRIDNV